MAVSFLQPPVPRAFFTLISFRGTRVTGRLWERDCVRQRLMPITRMTLSAIFQYSRFRQSRFIDPGFLWLTSTRTINAVFVFTLLSNWSYHDDVTSLVVLSSVRAVVWLDSKSRRLVACNVDLPRICQVIIPRTHLITATISSYWGERIRNSTEIGSHESNST